MAITSSINLDKVSSGIKSLNTGMGQLKKSVDNIKTVSLNKTRIKRESIARNKILSTMREEAVKRKDQESIIEASGISGAFKRTGKVIADSTKGFLGRLLDFASSLLLGWLLYNLPTIMTAIEDLITRIRTLYGILTEFMGNIRNTFINFGQLLSAVYQDITQFDFTDQSKRVQNAMNDLSANMDSMHDEFMRGFELLTTPLGQGPGEKEVPPLNTDYTQDGPTTGEGYATAGLSGASKKIIGKDTAFLGEVKRVSQKYGIKEGDLLGLLASESRFDPAAGEIGDHVGLIQFGVSEARSVGTTQDALKKMSRAEQMKYVDKYFETRKLKKGAGAGQLYATVFAPAYASGDPNTVLYSSPSREYASNAPLDSNRDGKITVAEMGGRIQQKKKEFGISDNVSIIPTGKTAQQPLSTNFASVSGTSGTVSGGIPLSVPYSPFKPGSGAVITSGKGYRPSTKSYHKGYDLAAASGTPLYAYFPGKVTHIGIDGTASSAGYGNWVVWKDDIYGAYHFFGHMRDRPSVKVGQVISQGTLIGYVGSTGISSGSHLHWEISSTAPASNGQFTSLDDPGAWLKKHPLKPIKASQTNAIDSPNPSPSSTLPAQVSSTTSPGQNVPSVAQNKKGTQIVIADNPQQPQPQQVSSGGGRSQPQTIPFEDSLNSLIKNQILLELAYT
jgi:murein DD-endopeptidase MepM/ murein hydrolase activator NlpD